MEAIYKMEFDCGRMGSLSGVFVADTDAMQKLIGTEVYFGEVLGKHSEIAGPIDEKDITLVTSDSDAVEMFKKHKLHSGYNPFDYVREEEEN
jgi:uncharacterized protein YdcH (DUF465 family)